jgi:hypothetical protein
VILGLPWTSWLLLILAVGLGLALSLTFYLSHRGEAIATDPGHPGPGDDADRREPD